MLINDKKFKQCILLQFSKKPHKFVFFKYRTETHIIISYILDLVTPKSVRPGRGIFKFITQKGKIEKFDTIRIKFVQL